MSLSAISAPLEDRTNVICAYAPSQSPAVNKISSTIAGAGTGAVVTLQSFGLTVVQHSSGAYILTGAGGYLAATMTGAAVAAFTIPVTVFVGGSAIAVELACAPSNHPDLVDKVLLDSKSYWTGRKEKVDRFFSTPKDGDTLRQTGDYWAEKVYQYLN